MIASCNTMRQPIKKSWLAPKGQRLCEPYQNLDGESQLSESTTSPCQRLARGLGSGLKPLLMKKGLGLMEDCRLCLQWGMGVSPTGQRPDEEVFRTSS